MGRIILSAVVAVWLLECPAFAQVAIFAVPQILNFFGQVTDPPNDALRDARVPVSPDLISASVTAGNGKLSLSVRFAPGTFNRQTSYTVFSLDTDQNPNTGFPFGDGTLGADFFVSLISPFFPLGQAGITVYAPSSRGCCRTVATVPVTYLSNGMDVTIPLSTIGNSNGQLNFKVTVRALLGGQLFTNFLDVMPNFGLPAGMTVPNGPGGSGPCVTDITDQATITRTGLNYIYPSNYAYSQSITVTVPTTQALSGQGLWLALSGLPTHLGFPNDVSLLGSQVLASCGPTMSSYVLPLSFTWWGPAPLPQRLTTSIPLIFFTQSLTTPVTYVPRILLGSPLQ